MDFCLWPVVRRWCAPPLAAIVLMVFLATTATAAQHPLDPLSKAEITATVDTLRAAGKLTKTTRFAEISLREPPKDEVLQFKPGAGFRREAFVVVRDHATRRTSEAVVDLNKKSVTSWKEVPGAQPFYPSDIEIKEVNKLLASDAAWQAALRKRGITDFDRVTSEPWPAGYYGIAEEEGLRLWKVVAYYQGNTVNYYARPIEGLSALVDPEAGKVINIVDTGVVPMATATAELDAKSLGRTRSAPKPLKIAQPEGASFSLRGNEVRWQNWVFRFGFHPRQGLVLYSVGYEDGGRLRSVLYRGSVSEMLVPYADPGPTWYFRNVFDEGEIGLGWMTGPQEQLADSPPNAVFVDAVLADEQGRPHTIPRAIALYERDGGLLWKHYDNETGKNASRRARDLVLSWITTIGNYDYGFNWVFHQDASLEMEVSLTGILEPRGVAETTKGDHGGPTHEHRVAERIAAVHHQHFLSFRLDLDVDGQNNSAVEMNTESVPEGPQNPFGREFVTSEVVLHSEKQAQRQLHVASSRCWKVINAAVHNSLGSSVGYALLAGENSVPYVLPQSWVGKRAGFVNAHLWVTPYEASEIYAAGDYPNQDKGGKGLPQWTSTDRAIENTDVVLWYTMGISHVPRPEEWPVMNVHRAGFKLVPDGFFARNPALDVPPETKHAGVPAQAR